MKTREEGPTLVEIIKPPQEWLTPPEAIAEALKRSLSKLLISFHPLAGRLTRIPRGRLEIQCNGIGVPLTEAESEATLVLKSLSYAAGRIRETISKVTNEYVNSTIHFLKGIDDLSQF
ncbi:Spermidine hydroxycinnamoyl transferase [Sesamum angolense]|uniref:Spermidine hydroxycinnamoyl transferase n=1 Tax=Sesamum angolense TaxID=2727404 RepID=A0AAE1X6P7_9LAMI|nr:Spermidine hydroxycinnamoyl transferase [Sesamum angolense]